MKRIYLDNAATSWPKAPGLGSVLSDYIENDCVNLNRTESSKAYDSFSWLYTLRHDICKIYNSDKPSNVVFTKNVTEALNWVIKGLIKKDDPVTVSGYEHNSVIRPLVQLGADWVVDSVRPKTIAVIVNAASNVTGKIVNLEYYAKAAEKAGAFFIIDAAQATPFIDIDMKKLKADAVCFTGHKGLLGPQGTGGFVINSRLAQVLNPLMSGGSGTQSDSYEIPSTMPEKFTCGTENLIGLKGLSYSVRYVIDNFETLHKSALDNIRYLYDGISRIEELEIVSEDPHVNYCGVISVKCKKYDISDIASYLSDNGVETRVGLHCSPLAHKTAGTFPGGTLRFSPGSFNTKEELDYVLKLITEFF